jgi:hypothetical protein
LHSPSIHTITIASGQQNTPQATITKNQQVCPTKPSGMQRTHSMDAVDNFPQPQREEIKFARRRRTTTTKPSTPECAIFLSLTEVFA